MLAVFRVAWSKISSLLRRRPWRLRALAASAFVLLGLQCTPVHCRGLLKSLETGQPAAKGDTDSAAAVQDSAESQSKGPEEKRPARQAQNGRSWIIGGVIENKVVTIEPLFPSDQPAEPDDTAGTYTVEVQDSNGSVLLRRHFSGLQGVIDSAPGQPAGAPVTAFQVLIPTVDGAARIVIKDRSDVQLGVIDFSGAPPTVTITSPPSIFTGTGTATLTWSVQDPDSTSFASIVSYSTDGGTTWGGIMDYRIDPGAVPIHFDRLPGSNGNARFRVEVSDGSHYAIAVSPLFSVPKKGPTVLLLEPKPGRIGRADFPMFLHASAADPEDGMLADSRVTWTSDRQGPLGQGNNLEARLQPGQHNLTVQARDSDGNTATASTSVTIAGDPPMLSMTLKELDPPWTTCAQVTIAAAKGANGGVDLSTVSYSVDGGATLVPIPLGQLPFTFTVPGSGTKQLGALAIDVADQRQFQLQSFVLYGSCQTKVMPISPPAAMLNGGQTQQFSTSVIGNSNAAVNWSVSLAPGAPVGAATGTISPGGQYTAPGTVASDYRVIVTAKSAADATKSESATVNLFASSEAIATPTLPILPSGMKAGVPYPFSTGGASSGAGHALQYQFDWGDGTTSGWLPIGTTSATHSWPRPGFYKASAQARCALHPTVLSQAAQLPVSIGGEGIAAPRAITGPTTGMKGIGLSFTATGIGQTDTRDPVQYRFVWGDGQTSDWLPVGSTSASHSWSRAGKFVVSVEARCATHNLVISAGTETSVTIGTN